ncbi:hypothetical protein A2415_02310 [candidate division WWE3 bacterium RIFOXYC1_FULL_39_7]|uniref:Uncharacterized protein n=2 Tax=Katanobacteria TaxID=422282 RepID=A0A1F4X673_UNCKA|nr:MAG: hypothetical protein A2415_02310 [candidate division WWE3 bacterium RIFOXYC1_FULL_39_7]OGC77051.1 MAG: hypothetical protein A2619_01480 [candidate division WWE3 bacterium RIFOXYD1_FULL_39_9]
MDDILDHPLIVCLVLFGAMLAAIGGYQTAWLPNNWCVGLAVLVLGLNFGPIVAAQSILKSNGYEPDYSLPWMRVGMEIGFGFLAGWVFGLFQILTGVTVPLF